MLSKILIIPRAVFLVCATLCIVGFPLSAQTPTASIGTAVEETVHSPSLSGNLLGDSPDRSVIVYLPPGYQHGTSRYPVIYLLHGFLGNNKSWIEGGWANVPKIMDRLIAQGKVREMIVVMPDASNKLGGSFYTNSVTTGNWEDFIASDLVKFIDGKYRTLPLAIDRGISGHSMGGYGAIKIAMKHPEIFGAVYALSACCMEWGGGISPSNPAWEKTQAFHNLGDVDAARLYIFKRDFNFQDPEVPRDFFALALASLSAAWSPDVSHPPLYAGFLVNGSGDAQALSEKRMSEWSANMPVAMLSQYRSNLSQLRAIAFDVGRQDENVDIPAGARDFDAELKSNGISHQFEEYEGTHMSKIGDRLEHRAFPFFSRSLN